MLPRNHTSPEQCSSNHMSLRVVGVGVEWGGVAWEPKLESPKQPKSDPDFDSGSGLGLSLVRSSD